MKKVLQMLDPDEAVKFHGHPGPFLAWGYRAAVFAVKKLEPKDHKDMLCTAVIPLRTPYSCILDGIQSGSPCTLGKQNLKVVPGNEVMIIFESSKGRICLKPALSLEQILREKDENTAYKAVILKNDDELFIIEEK
ncbi:MAG: formylmethanofuran dehydrogenase subunit E family protein [Thermofilaceae archaeon]